MNELSESSGAWTKITLMVNGTFLWDIIHFVTNVSSPGSECGIVILVGDCSGDSILLSSGEGRKLLKQVP